MPETEPVNSASPVSLRTVAAVRQSKPGAYQFEDAARRNIDMPLNLAMILLTTPESRKQGDEDSGESV